MDATAHQANMMSENIEPRFMRSGIFFHEGLHVIRGSIDPMSSKMF